MTVNGIDVASYQSTTFTTAGLSFAFAKATEGTGYVNPHHDGQILTARVRGLVAGHYHFQRPGSPTAQAAYFLQHAKPQPGDILACDWEDPGVSDADKDTFIRAVRAAAPVHQVLLYCNLDFWLHRDHAGFTGDGLWIADPDAPAGHPRVKTPWQFHQYGIRGADLDVGNFADIGALRTWAAKGTKPPAPKPPAPKPPTKPSVDLSNLVAAARTDPKAKQGHTTHPADVRIVEAALRAEGLLPDAYAGDGSFGTKTVLAYAAWQRHLGYVGAAADGIPGMTSLTKLGQKHGFTVVA
jgi:hypothetical protein